MSTLTNPHTWVTNDVMTAALMNGFPNAVVAWSTNIDKTNIGSVGLTPQNLKPGTTTEATFGGTVGSIFLSPATNVVPLTISGVSSQSADIFDVTLTSGGTKAFFVNSSGLVASNNGLFGDGGTTQQNATTGIALGTRGTAFNSAVARWGLTGGGTQVGSINGGTSSTVAGVTGSLMTFNNVGVATLLSFDTSGNLGVAGTLATGAGYIIASNQGTPSSPSSLANGDLVAQRSASHVGFLILGDSTSSGIMEYNNANAGALSLRNAANNGYIQMFGTSFTNSSDATLKTNVQPIADALTSVKALKPVSFDWKHDGSSSLGFLAQDVQSVLPELVSTDATGIMGVNYAGIIPVLVQAFLEYVAAHP